MVKVYYDGDADLERLKGLQIAIIGYGSQGHAHALNLRDSGCKVMVGLYKGSRSWAQAEGDGLAVSTVAEATQSSDIIMMLAPDQAQSKIYKESVEKALTKGKMLMFAHGFNIHYSQILPPPAVDVTMVAPKAPGHRMRTLFTQGVGVPALLAVHQDATGRAKDLTLAYAKGLGCTKAGVLECTFREETETDLFGEQAVLCGGLTSLIMAGFETLVEAGYPAELAYFEVCHETKLIVDLIYEGGMARMRYSVSDTAEFGDYTRGPRVINESVRKEMKKILAEIQDGTFAREWILENQAGQPGFRALRKKGAEHPIEVVGKQLREMMGFLKTEKPAAAY